LTATEQREALEMLAEGDDLLVPAFVARDQAALNRLRVLAYLLCRDHGCTGADLARRWGRDRRTISLWRKQGAKLRDS
jgi:hypothetical protein